MDTDYSSLRQRSHGVGPAGIGCRIKGVGFRNSTRASCRRRGLPACRRL